MRVLAITESPPTTDPLRGNGSTLITAELIEHLPGDVEVDLVYFQDRSGGPDARVLRRVRSVRCLPLRPGWAGWASLPFTRLPRATWLRAAPVADLQAWSREADLVYLHGLHVAPLARHVAAPALVNEVDPWSEHWRERASGRGWARGGYDRLQARRAAALEQAVAGWATCTVVVNPSDAARLGSRTGGRVVAIPNGVSVGAAPCRATASSQVAFVGTLDYPPNIEAVRRLVREVWPLVRRAVPEARLVVAGRRPTPELLALREPGVDLLGQVADVTEVFGASAAAAYVGLTGRGTKNTVAEAIAAGCPVVASPESARGHAPGEHLAIGDGPQALADLLVALLTDEPRRSAAEASAARTARAANSWATVAERYASLMRSCAART